MATAIWKRTGSRRATAVDERRSRFANGARLPTACNSKSQVRWGHMTENLKTAMGWAVIEKNKSCTADKAGTDEVYRNHPHLLVNDGRCNFIP